MPRINAHYLDLGTSYLFSEIRRRGAHVVGVPGSGFGPSGEGYVRLTAFGSREQTEEAVERIRTRR
jgi:LL-diaminopimelate aminotransferase